MATRVGLVTVTYNSGDVIGPFLDCVARQTIAAAAHLVVVDNASSDGCLQEVRRRGSDRVTVIANASNRGVAEGNNQGIEVCRQLGIEWIVLINNDTEFEPRLIEAMLESAIDLGARVLVPRITYHERPDLVWFGGGYFSWWRGFQARHVSGRAAGKHDAPSRTAYAPTCCMLVRSDVFDEVGTMDPAYFVYWDDTDFCWRLGLRAIPIWFDPRLELSHKVSTLTGGEQSGFSVRHYSRNQVYFLRKHFPPRTVAWNVAWIRFKNRVRRLIGLDDGPIAAQRRAAIEEGLRMPIEQPR